MSYTNNDFAESLNISHVPADLVESVIAAWGRGDGQGEDSGPNWSEDGVSDWAGGFLLKLKAGGYAYVTGWCDYTGWGCQDGADVTFSDTLPVLKDLNPDEAWDEEPADLNKWLRDGCPDL